MRVRDFDFDLPTDLIAQRPLGRRDDSRMMVVRRSDGAILHKSFRDFPDFLNAGDLLVLNDTKVIPAKAWGKRGQALVEFLFIKEREPGAWEVLCKPARRIRNGDKIIFDEEFEAEAVDEGDGGRRILRFSVPDVLGRLKKIGFAPLPPYIKRKKADAATRSEDLARYQTVFAASEGAIAAPTAGLHFTPEILEGFRSSGVGVAQVTLHVGLATFQPMRVERLEDHRMLEETYSISETAAFEINRAKSEGRPVVAVGTTVVRTLESAAHVLRYQSGPQHDGEIPPHPPLEKGGSPSPPSDGDSISRASLLPFDKGGKGGFYRSAEDSRMDHAEIGRPLSGPDHEGTDRCPVRPGERRTALFIHPGFEFRVVDRLLTNFHLPKSTLLLLVSAFAGRDLILVAYREAVRERYRFFSYGDCMLIL